MQNIVMNMCEKFHYDRLRNDGGLEDCKSDNDNNPNKNNIRSALKPVSGSKKRYRVPVFLLPFPSCIYSSSCIHHSQLGLRYHSAIRHQIGWHGYATLPPEPEMSHCLCACQLVDGTDCGSYRRIGLGLRAAHALLVLL